MLQYKREKYLKNFFILFKREGNMPKRKSLNEETIFKFILASLLVCSAIALMTYGIMTDIRRSSVDGAQIIMCGNSHTKIMQGERYFDVGVYAYNRYGSNITSQIDVGGPYVNTKKPGTYKIIYKIQRYNRFYLPYETVTSIVEVVPKKDIEKKRFYL
jgi:hypothetical protein